MVPGVAGREGALQADCPGDSLGVLQPVINMVVFSMLFGGLLKVPSNGVPYPIFSFAALLPWNFFAGAITRLGRQPGAKLQPGQQGVFPAPGHPDRGRTGRVGRFWRVVRDLRGHDADLSRDADLGSAAAAAVPAAGHPDRPGFRAVAFGVECALP